MTNPMYLDVDAASDAFSVSPRTVERWIKEGCPSVRSNGKSGKHLLSPTTVAEWLEHRSAVDEAIAYAQQYS